MMKKLIDFFVKIFNSNSTQTELSLSNKSRKGQGRPTYKISTKGIELICRLEGFSSHVYNDIVGNPTIGYGHKLLAFESYKTISQADAQKLLEQDVRFAETAVNKHVTTLLEQEQFDALVSFVYNVGETAFRKSKLLQLINNGDFKAASIEILKWNHAAGEPSVGLLNRRHIESLALYRVKVKAK